jgi:hypothetical protein
MAKDNNLHKCPMGKGSVNSFVEIGMFNLFLTTSC